MVKKNTVRLEYVSTHENPADALTKPLESVKFDKHKEKLLGKRKQRDVVNEQQGIKKARSE